MALFENYDNSEEEYVTGVLPDKIRLGKEYIKHCRFLSS
jgi:hypothetical protein